MRSLKTVLAVSLFCFTQSIQAQSVGSILGVGYSLGYLNSSSFETFFGSYNTYHQAQLKTPFRDDFGKFNGPGFLSRVVFTGSDDGGFLLGAIIGYSAFNSENRATFNNGDTRFLEFRAKYIHVGMDFGFKAGPLYLSTSFSMVSMPTYLNIGMDYSDGTRSFGTEYWMNGIYWSNRIGWAGGAIAAIKLHERILLNVCGNYLLPPATNEYALSITTFADNNYYRTVPSLPEDIALFAANPGAVENVAKHDFSGLIVSVALCYLR